MNMSKPWHHHTPPILVVVVMEHTCSFSVSAGGAAESFHMEAGGPSSDALGASRRPLTEKQAQSLHVVKIQTFHCFVGI